MMYKVKCNTKNGNQVMNPYLLIIKQMRNAEDMGLTKQVIINQ